MPRTSISTAYRNALEAAHSAEVDLIFLTMTHADLDDPIRVVNDVALPGGEPIEYDRDGVRWVGCPFSLTLLSEDDSPPRGRLEIANVDRSIGLAVLAIYDSPDLTIEVMRGSLFSRVGASKVWAASGALAELTVSNVRLQSISCAPWAVSGEIVSYDFTREPYGVRATKGRFPGLYR